MCFVFCVCPCARARIGVIACQLVRSCCGKVVESRNAVCTELLAVDVLPVQRRLALPPCLCVHLAAQEGEACKKWRLTPPVHNDSR